MVMDGDAHINNFGMYGTPQREVVFDLNDFDEATIGPWEWDLKRLVASVNVAGRQNGLNRRERAAAVSAAWRAIDSMSIACRTWVCWTSGTCMRIPDATTPLPRSIPKSKAVFAKTMAKALRTDNRTLLPKVADQHGNGKWTFRNDPPVLTTIPGATKEKVIEVLNRYSLTLSAERRMMLGRYHVADVAHRVVGVGSVGTRAYLVLLFGVGDDDPLFLQVKESVSPAACSIPSASSRGVPSPGQTRCDRTARAASFF